MGLQEFRVSSSYLLIIEMSWVASNFSGFQSDVFACCLSMLHPLCLSLVPPPFGAVVGGGRGLRGAFAMRL